MESTRRRTAQRWIVSGYFVIFGGTLIGNVWQISSGFFQQSWREDLNMSSLIFASFTAIVAWWFLSRIVANTPDQMSLIRKAYLGLALQALLLSSNFVIYLVSFPDFSWASASTWGYALGTISTTIGFFLMATSYPSSSPAPDGVVVGEG